MNVNIVTLAGRLTRDIEFGYTPSQVAISKTGLAINKKYKDKESVVFIDITCFGKQAETLSKYVKKGDPLFIVGELQFDSWTGKDNQKHSKHSIIVKEFQFLSSGEAKPAAQNTAPAEPTDMPDF